MLDDLYMSEKKLSIMQRDIFSIKLDLFIFLPGALLFSYFTN